MKLTGHYQLKINNMRTKAFLLFSYIQGLILKLQIILLMIAAFPLNASGYHFTTGLSVNQ